MATAFQQTESRAPTKVHVSLHDVSPAFAVEVEMALALAAEHGARPALLVVPNYHEQWPLLDHPAFVDRLQDLAEKGHETYLHGLFHKSRPKISADLAASGLATRALWYFAQHGASDHEAEFRDLTPDEAAARLCEGERTLAIAGLPIHGFVPPAWSMPRWLLSMLGERGYRFCEDHLRVYDPQGRRSRVSAVLNYATRTPARLVSTLAYCRAALPLSTFLPTRIAIHPADMRFDLVRREIARLLRSCDGRFASGPDLF
jgi:predicted deacetylase